MQQSDTDSGSANCDHQHKFRKTVFKLVLWNVIDSMKTVVYLIITISSLISKHKYLYSLEIQSAILKERKATR